MTAASWSTADIVGLFLLIILGCYIANVMRHYWIVWRRKKWPATTELKKGVIFFRRKDD